MRPRPPTAQQCLLLARIAWWNCYPQHLCWCNSPRPKRFPKGMQGELPGLCFSFSPSPLPATAVLSLALRLRPKTSRLGMVITIAALFAMPILATLKRREARRTNNVALAADAIQSATCAYLALITLAGLAANAVFHIPWIDSLAALVAVPILLHEGRSAWQGHACGCC